MKLRLLLVLFLSFMTTALSAKEETWKITCQDDFLNIHAGKYEKVLSLDRSTAVPVSFRIDGSAFHVSGASEMSFRILKAQKGWQPDYIRSEASDRYTRTEVSFGKTDELKVNQVKMDEKSASGWVEVASVRGSDWNRFFALSNVRISEPRAGVTRATLRWRGNGSRISDEFSFSLCYEIYAGYPAVRQWIELVNNTAEIYKIDRLILSDTDFSGSLPVTAALTPDHGAAPASIRSFSTADKSRGLILGSEIPSATRRLDAVSGRMGYADDYFEWILMPSEHFTSEPVNFYAYSGEVYPTVSSVSIPLDRCVDREYKKFLDRCIGVAANRSNPYVPRYATWSNYAWNISEDICRKIIPIAAACGFKLFEIDDGWQRDRLGSEPHPEKFRHMDEIADMVKEYGMDLGIWVSCFRSKDAKDVKAMPNAFSQPLIKRLDGYGMSFASDWRNYFANDLVYLRDRYDAKFFKEDFSNIIFGDLACGHESRSVKESYLKALRGLLSAQKRIVDQASDVTTMVSHEIYWATPGVPCDMAMMKHSGCYHIPPNDYSGLGGSCRVQVSEYTKVQPLDVIREKQYQGCFNARKRYFSHRGLPLHMLEYYGAAVANVNGSLTAGIQDRQICSFLMGIPTVYAGDLLTLTQENIAHYRKRFALVEEYQKKYDIYRQFQFSGVPVPTDEDWHWWGKLNEEGRGVVVVVRGSAGDNQRRINIPWVLPDRRYMVKSLFTDRVLGEFSGKELQNGQLKIRLDRMGQDILAVE